MLQREYGSPERKDLLRQITMLLFGTSRLSAKAEDALLPGLDLVQARGWCAIEGEILRWIAEAKAP
jgi:hypothetical protein